MAQRPESKESNALAWLLENGIVLCMSFLKSYADFATMTHPSVARPIRPVMIGMSNLALIEGIILCQHILIRTVYRDTQSHSKGPSRPVHVPSCMLTVHMPVNLISMTVACMLFGLDGMDSVSDPLGEAATWTAWQWLVNFAAYRAVYDVAFYAFHMAMHRIPSMYTRVHSTHHAHRSTDLTTNYQFTAVDLFVEAMLTNFVAQMALMSMNDTVPYLAMVVFGTYVQWYQIGSHAPQRIPAVTAFPPLSPIYNHPLAKRMRPKELRSHDAVRFHAEHHRKVKGNYGITPWMDWLCGTMASTGEKDH